MPFAKEAQAAAHRLDSDPGSQSTLDDLLRYRELGAEAFPRMKRLANLVRRVMAVPFVSISMLPETGLCRMASSGFSEHIEPPRGLSFTKNCIDCGEPIAISDIRNHSVLKHHELVVNYPHFQSSLSVPVRNEDGVMVGAVNVWDTLPRVFSQLEISLLEDFADIVSMRLDLLRAVSVVEKRNTLFQAIFENAAVGISVNGPNGKRIAVNAHFCKMLGYEESELIDRPIMSIVHPEDRDHGVELCKQLNSGDLKSYEREARIIKKDGSSAWVKIFHSNAPIAGRTDGFGVAIFVDVDARRKSEAARALLLGEINHRVKNSLAIIQGIAKQLIRHTRTPEEFGSAFESRIQALAKSHDMLTDVSWEPLSLERLITDLLAGVFEPYHQQVAIEVMPVNLNAQTTVMLTLLLNELLTNAVKHGALADEAGKIQITASTRTANDLGWVELSWMETAARPIEKPQYRGLGMYLIEKAPRLGLGGAGHFNFTQNGLNYKLSFPAYPTTEVFRHNIRV